MELAQHPEMVTLMQIAFTCEQGQNEGEYMMRCNPKFKREAKQKAKKME